MDFVNGVLLSGNFENEMLESGDEFVYVWYEDFLILCDIGICFDILFLVCIF